MVEEQRARIDQSMTKMIDDLDKAHLRQLQGDMFKCSAKCCEDKNGSVTSVQRCIENCSLTLQAAQKYVQMELDHLQGRLQRCIMNCNDTIRDKMGTTTSDSDIKKYTTEFESCSSKCVDAHLDLITLTMKKMNEMLKKKEFQTPNY